MPLDDESLRKEFQAKIFNSYATVAVGSLTPIMIALATFWFNNSMNYSDIQTKCIELHEHFIDLLYRKDVDKIQAHLDDSLAALGQTIEKVCYKVDISTPANILQALGEVASQSANANAAKAAYGALVAESKTNAVAKDEL